MLILFETLNNSDNYHSSVITSIVSSALSLRPRASQTELAKGARLLLSAFLVGEKEKPNTHSHIAHRHSHNHYYFHTQGMSSPNSFGQLGLSILGVGTQYPPYSLKPDAVETLAKRFHNVDGDSMKKVLSINRFTGIEVSFHGLVPPFSKY